MWILDKLKGWLIGAGLIIAAIGVAFLKGRKAGVEHMEAEQAKHRIKAMEDRKAVDDDIQNLGSNTVDQRMAKWLRDGR